MMVSKLVKRPSVPKSAGPYMRVSNGAAASVKTWPRAEPALKIPTFRAKELPRRSRTQDREAAGVSIIRASAGTRDRRASYRIMRRVVAGEHVSIAEARYIGCGLVHDF